MPTTQNLGLVNVLESENFDIDVYNGNNDKVDSFAGAIEKDYVLFKNANGATGTVALSDSAANYNEIKIKLIWRQHNIFVCLGFWRTIYCYRVRKVDNKRYECNHFSHEQRHYC